MPYLVSSIRPKIPAGHESLTGNGWHGGRGTLERWQRFRLPLRGGVQRLYVYTKNANRWVIGGEYLHKKYDYKDMRIPVEQFTAEGGYYLKFLSDRRKTFFLSLGLSALAGYETSNRGGKLLPDGATLLDKDCFIYGGALTLELETYLTDRMVLLVNARERMLFGSDIGKFHTQVGMGLKFIIN